MTGDDRVVNEISRRVDTDERASGVVEERKIEIE